MSRMTDEQAERFRAAADIVCRASEGGMFEDIESAWAGFQDWSTGERDLAREAWIRVEALLDDDFKAASKSEKASLVALGPRRTRPHPGLRDLGRRIGEGFIVTAWRPHMRDEEFDF